mmetsp:Transcript_130561/g.279111  ORF Transcript_130561/g.279111 Transcript_130561/m.279111 type:complete len:620 (+) Transcript_130561:144-2003(+)
MACYDIKVDLRAELLVEREAREALELAVVELRERLSEGLQLEREAREAGEAAARQLVDDLQQSTQACMSKLEQQVTDLWEGFMTQRTCQAPESPALTAALDGKCGEVVISDVAALEQGIRRIESTSAQTTGRLQAVAGSVVALQREVRDLRHNVQGLRGRGQVRASDKSAGIEGDGSLSSPGVCSGRRSRTASPSPQNRTSSAMVGSMGSTVGASLLAGMQPEASRDETLSASQRTWSPIPAPLSRSPRSAAATRSEEVPSPTSPQVTMEPASSPGDASVAVTPLSRMRSAPAVPLWDSPRLGPTQFSTVLSPGRDMAALHSVTCSQPVSRRCSLYAPGAYGGSPYSSPAVTIAAANAMGPTPRLLVAHSRPADAPPGPMLVAGAGGAGPASPSREAALAPSSSPVSARAPSPPSRAETTDVAVVATATSVPVAAPAVAEPGRRQISCGSMALPVGTGQQPLPKAVLRCAAPPPQARQERVGETGAAAPASSAHSATPAPKAVSTHRSLLKSGSVRASTPKAIPGQQLVKQAAGYVPVMSMSVAPIASVAQELPRALSVPAMHRRPAEPSPKSGATAAAPTAPSKSPTSGLGTRVTRPPALAVKRQGTGTAVKGSPGRS